MAWILLVPCICATLLSASYYDAFAPIGYLIFPVVVESQWGRLMSVAITTFVFLIFAFFANRRSFKIDSGNHWAWFALLGNVSLAIADFGGSVLDLPQFKLLVPLLILAVVCVTVIAAVQSSRLPRQNSI